MSNLAHTEGKEDVILKQIQKILGGGYNCVLYS